MPFKLQYPEQKLMANKQYIAYTDGWNWILEEETEYDTGILGFNITTEFIRLQADGLMTISRKYASDGVTCITGTPWAWLLEKDWMKRGAYGHDALYQLVQLQLLPMEYKLVADHLMRSWCIEDGAWGWEAQIVFRLVDKYGAASVDHRKQRKILIAPKKYAKKPA
jgi:hypothetical protein